MDQIERITYYENILNEAEKAVSDCETASETHCAAQRALLALRGRIAELGRYYGSGEWKNDLAADEAGLLPPDLRRGVLSEDGVWNLLERARELDGPAKTLIDITLPVTDEMADASMKNDKMKMPGHLGTHFDVVGKTFPLAYTRRSGIVLDVARLGDPDAPLSGKWDREIGLADVDLSVVGPDMFVAFRTGFIEEAGYGTAVYHDAHPQLSAELIDALLDRGVSIIGVDFGGIRRNPEHPLKDRCCAERGTFVVENLTNLQAVLDASPSGRFTACTYPVNFVGMTGLPCRVIAEV